MDLDMNMKYLGPQDSACRKGDESYKIKGLTKYTFYLILLEWSNQENKSSWII